MSEAKKRKVHAPEFKAKVGLEALRGVKTINEIGLEFGVHPVQVGQWKKDIQEQVSTLFDGKGRSRWQTNLIRFIQGSAKPRPTHLKPHRKHAYKSTT